MTEPPPSLPHIERFRLGDPDNREVLLTPGCRTILVSDLPRVFGHDGLSRLAVGWLVRLLPAPFAGGGLSPEIIALAVADSSDVLALAAQYLPSRPPLFDADGLSIAGDASYGPAVDGSEGRWFGSDFNDYLGITWAGDEQPIAPDSQRVGMVDCSGFVRLVYGYRAGLPLSFAPRPGALPRHSWEMAVCDLGKLVAVLPARPEPAALEVLLPGDLLFWGSLARRHGIHHVGIYAGRNERGRPCAFSSSIIADGPVLRELFTTPAETLESVFYLARRI